MIPAPRRIRMDSAPAFRKLPDAPMEPAHVVPWPARPLASRPLELKCLTTDSFRSLAGQRTVGPARNSIWARRSASISWSAGCTGRAARLPASARHSLKDLKPDPLLGSLEQAGVEPKSAGWKLAVAAWMKTLTQAGNAWLSQRLHLGAPAAFSRNLTGYRRQPRSTDKLWGMLTSISAT